MHAVRRNTETSRRHTSNVISINVVQWRSNEGMHMGRPNLATPLMWFYYICCVFVGPSPGLIAGIVIIIIIGKV